MRKEVKIGILFFALWFSISGYAQISPGDLVEAHAHLEGISNCTECHVLGDKVSNEKCLACHTLIKERIAQKKGYHASEEVNGKQCASCHNDHHGRSFQIIRFKTDTFRHALTGYQLEGAHTEINCSECHKAEYIHNPDIQKLKNTYLGLGTNCLDCHVDYHQGTLETNCASCHNQKEFKPATLFNHEQTDYPLRGKHRQLDCEQCHPKKARQGKDFQQFSGIASAKCTDCHEDVHNNKFGQNCTQCHSVNSFQRIKNQAKFNHALTNYPLEGMHTQVDCKECHKAGLTAGLAYAKCTDCHTDYHKNELDVNGKDPDCAQCHSVNGFMPSSYSIEEHNKSSFELAGAHLATPCFSCHLKKDEWRFHSLGTHCVDCHENIHEQFIAEKYYPNQDCKTCHTEKSWGGVVFDHNQTSFELKGAHTDIGCRACHFSQSEKGNLVQNFSQFSGNCTDCHDDIHQGQFNEQGKTDCLRCHAFESFKIADFDHSKTLFPLNGAHEKVSCTECHLEIKTKKSSYINYKIKEFKCADCHS